MHTHDSDWTPGEKQHGSAIRRDEGVEAMASMALAAGRTDALPPAAVMHLQRVAGNDSVASLLEAEGAGPVGQLQELQHAFPAVHAAPADLAFRGQALAVVRGDVAGLPKRVGDPLLAAFGVLVPVVDPARRVDADAAVRPRPQLTQPPANPVAP